MLCYAIQFANDEVEITCMGSQTNDEFVGMLLCDDGFPAHLSVKNPSAQLMPHVKISV